METKLRNDDEDDGDNDDDKRRAALSIYSSFRSSRNLTILKRLSHFVNNIVNNNSVVVGTLSLVRSIETAPVILIAVLPRGPADMA